MRGEMKNWAIVVPELAVMDIAASLHFYVALLGFGIRYDRPEERFAYLELGGAQLMIEQSSAPWLTGSLEKPLGRGINLQIEVQTTTGMLSRLSAAGWPLFMELHDSWYRSEQTLLGNRQFLVQDPDGYLLRFFEDIGERPA